jgi:hypothetical protein
LRRLILQQLPTPEGWYRKKAGEKLAVFSMDALRGAHIAQHAVNQRKVFGTSRRQSQPSHALLRRLCAKNFSIEHAPPNQVRPIPKYIDKRNPMPVIEVTGMASCQQVNRVIENGVRESSLVRAPRASEVIERIVKQNDILAKCLAKSQAPQTEFKLPLFVFTARNLRHARVVVPHEDF